MGKDMASKGLQAARIVRDSVGLRNDAGDYSLEKFVKPVIIGVRQFGTSNDVRSKYPSS